MYLTRLQKLPENVKQVIFGEDDANTTDELVDSYNLSDDQAIFAYNVYLQIVLGDKKVLSLLEYLARTPDSGMLDVRGLARDIAIKKLWPLQEYLGDVDVLISRLGGRVPTPVSLPHTDDVTPPADRWLEGDAKDILRKNKHYEELYLTKKPIRYEGDRLKAPSVANWLQDYLHSMGAKGASTLKRSQYVAQNKNAQKLNESEKRNLLNFLTSYEDGTSMYWRVAEEQYVLIEPELSQKEKETGTHDEAVHEMSDMATYYRTIQEQYAVLFAEKKSGLELEIAGNTNKLPDILWESLGLEDAERAMTAIDLMIDHHAFFDTLKIDQRFKGIFARSLTVRYGTEAKTFWNGDLTHATSLNLFWKLILLEKLKLEEDRAAIIADYFSKKLGIKNGPAYLDRSTGKFLFREVAYRDRSFSFA